MTDIEKWTKAPGVAGLDVSDLGMVRNRQGRVWPGYVDANGYRRVSVKKPGGRGTACHRVHRLVLEAFVGPCPPGMETRHLNGDRGDNRLVNLVWGTSSENNHDTVRHGGSRQANRTHCPRRHPLAGSNLVPWQWKQRGRRACLACEYARKFNRRRGLGLSVDSAEFQALADSYFAALGVEAEGRVA